MAKMAILPRANWSKLGYFGAEFLSAKIIQTTNLQQHSVVLCKKKINKNKTARKNPIFKK